MTPALETERLVLQPLQLSDAPSVQELFPHWEIVQYLNAVVPWPYPTDGALTYYRDLAIPAIERGDEWHWSLRLKDHPEQLIGMIALFRTREDNRGFWLGLRWQGRGLMAEAAAAVSDFWFDVLGFPVLRVQKAVANLASRRISEQAAMRLVTTHERDYVSGRLPTQVLEITAEEWREHKLKMQLGWQPSEQRAIP